MARTNQKPANQQHQAPDFLAWHVTQKGEKSFWNKVGAAWAHKDSKGFTLQLEVMPINGRIVLRQPLDEPVKNRIRLKRKGNNMTNPLNSIGGYHAGHPWYFRLGGVGAAKVCSLGF